MATVEKKLKTLDVYLLYDGEKVTISDTADDNKATRALNEFKKYETMHYETEENGQKVTNAIPYHAVEHIEATESGGGDLDYKLWLTGEITEDTPCDPDFKASGLIATSDADLQALLANPSDYAVKLNSTELPTFLEQHGESYFAYAWAISESETKPLVMYSNAQGVGEAWVAYTECDFVGDVNVYVAHK